MLFFMQVGCALGQRLFPNAHRPDESHPWSCAPGPVHFVGRSPLCPPDIDLFEALIFRKRGQVVSVSSSAQWAPPVQCSTFVVKERSCWIWESSNNEYRLNNAWGKILRAIFYIWANPTGNLIKLCFHVGGYGAFDSLVAMFHDLFPKVMDRWQAIPIPSSHYQSRPFHQTQIVTSPL